MINKKRLSVALVIVLILSLAAGTVTSFAETNQQKLNRFGKCHLYDEDLYKVTNSRL